MVNRSAWRWFWIVSLILFLIIFGLSLAWALSPHPAECTKDSECHYGGVCDMSSRTCNCTMNLHHWHCDPLSRYDWHPNWYGFMAFLLFLIWFVVLVTHWNWVSGRTSYERRQDYMENALEKAYKKLNIEYKPWTNDDKTQ